MKSGPGRPDEGPRPSIARLLRATVEALAEEKLKSGHDPDPEVIVSEAMQRIGQVVNLCAAEAIRPELLQAVEVRKQARRVRGAGRL